MPACWVQDWGWKRLTFQQSPIWPHLLFLHTDLSLLFINCFRTFFFFFSPKNKLSHSCSSVQQSLPTEQSVGLQDWVLQKTCWLWNRRGVVLFQARSFQHEQAYFFLKKKKKGEDLIPWSLKLRKKKKHTVFFIQGGDIFLAGGHRLSQKEKLKCCSTPVSNLILGIPFEESWVSAQEVWNSGQDSLTSGI